jgi:hypothetical protein
MALNLTSRGLRDVGKWCANKLKFDKKLSKDDRKRLGDNMQQLYSVATRLEKENK